MSLRTDIATIVMGLAEYYEKTLTDTQLAMYVEDLMDISPEDLLRAVRLYRRDGKNDRFPLPTKLRATLQPPDDQRARDAVALIMTAICRIGNYRTKDAQAFIGELGWEVVKLQGGWEVVCSISEADKGMLQAQWRELAISLLNKHRLGISGEAPTLEFKQKKTGQLEALGPMLNIPKSC